ncbi:MAG: hypothetical protein IKJ97_04625 [Bacteroidaceae bacterium]|nr:hypothetical protein [Bacteroidaceae bacterium]
MKKIMFVAVMAFAMVSCGNQTVAADAQKCSECIDSIATEVVPAAATEVLPAAAPSEENGGKVATEVIPAEPAK